MTRNLYINGLQRAARTCLTALTLVGIALFTGCSGDIPVAPEASTDASAATIPQSANSNGLVVQSFPEENPGPPFYSSGHGASGQAGFGALRTDGEWVAITFLREPDCVPDAFNLLSGPNPGPFACQLTIEGRIWLRDLSNPSNPVKSEHSGLGSVPVYFVHLSEYEAAVTDGVLTIVELEGMPSLLVGYASSHKDVIQFPVNGRPGMHSVLSRGELEDGRSFQQNSVNLGAENVQTTIVFE